MEAYTDFASVYDELMDNTPYERWCDNIVKVLGEYGIRDGLVLDMGCGTGSLTELLAAKGYDMIGVDYSKEMLNIAFQKREKSGYERIRAVWNSACYCKHLRFHQLSVRG